jgi:hypothetical protein
MPSVIIKYHPNIKIEHFRLFHNFINETMGENPLRCTTQEEKNLVLIAFLFDFIF